MAYLHHPPGPQQLMPSAVADTHDRDTRKKTVDKFLARAEVAMVCIFLLRRVWLHWRDPDHDGCPECCEQMFTFMLSIYVTYELVVGVVDVVLLDVKPLPLLLITSHSLPVG